MSGPRFIDNISNGVKHAFNRAFNNPYKEVNIGWLKFKILKHLPAGKLRQHRLFGKNLYFTNPQELLHGLEEIFIEKVYLQQLPKDAFIIDCGANIGLSVIYLKHLQPEATIVAFEPDEKNFDLLQKNIASFGLTQVQLRKEAVWISNEQLQFAVTGTMGSSITTNTATNSIAVQGARLKDILNRKVDFLKIDIEGAEYEVLKDIASQLHVVSNLFIEYHGTYSQNNELLEMLSLLTQNGFDFYIKEAAPIYEQPFTHQKNPAWNFDLQLNIFCVRK